MKEKKERPSYSVFSNIGFMLKEARESAPSVIVIALLIVLLTVALQTVELLFTPAIIEIIEEGRSLKELVVLILQFLFLLLIINGLLGYIRENAMFGRIEIRSGIVSKVSQKQGVTSYPNIFKADYQKLLDRAQRALSSNDEPGESIWETLTLIFTGILASLVYMYFMIRISYWIVFLTIATTVVSFFLSKGINEWGYRKREELARLSKEMGYLTNRSSNYIDAKDIRIFNMGPWLEELYDKRFKLYKGLMFKSQRIYFLADLIDLVLTFLRNLISYTYLIKLTLDGSIDIANFVLLFTAINGLIQWINNLLINVTKLYKESLELSILREFLNYPEVFKFEDGLAIEADPNKRYKIELKNLYFRYPNAEEDILKNINLTIQEGEKLAIVGLNGAGKTTLVKLITGLYDPSQGSVLMNGQAIEKHNRFDIYEHFGAVFQEFSLIAGSLYENIGQDREGNIDLSLADSIIVRVGLSNKIKSLPEAGHTKLVKDVYEDAVELSGGELQRLILGRALYKNAPILILDEPTAALDPIAENEIYLRYRDMTEKHTSIFISHRLASTRFCDRILFIADGEILEEGSHDQLIEANGPYAQLFNIQSRYYKKEGGRINE